MPVMNRDDLMRRFEQWLDGALAAEDPPGGIDAEILASLAAESEDLRYCVCARDEIVNADSDTLTVTAADIFG